jgi:hypothetical protein
LIFKSLLSVNTKVGLEHENVDWRVHVTQIVLLRVHNEHKSVDARLKASLRECGQGKRGKKDVGAPPHLELKINSDQFYRWCQFVYVWE